MANFNNNIYFFTIFACCREKFLFRNNENRDEAQHRGISIKTMQENKAKTVAALLDAKT